MMYLVNDLQEKFTSGVSYVAKSALALPHLAMRPPVAAPSLGPEAAQMADTFFNKVLRLCLHRFM